MAGHDEKPASPTFAQALRAALKESGVSQKELSRRLAGTKTSTVASEAKRSQILKWLRGRHEPEEESARDVERALGLEAGVLQVTINRKPRGLPARLSREQELLALREELAALRADVARQTDPLEARLQALEAQAAEREKETKDLARLVAGLARRVTRLEGGASQKQGGSP